MENFPFKHTDGKTYWYSRSMAVAVFIFTNINGKLHVLMNKRGPGTPDFQGYWSAPCGYLDHNETLAEAAARECKEEVGLDINPNELIPMYVNSKPTENRQNVTQRYITYIPYERFTEEMFTTEFSENEEVSEIRWIPTHELANKSLQVAFGHDNIVMDYAHIVYNLLCVDVYSSYKEHKKINMYDIESYSVVDIKGMLFVVDTLKTATYTHGKFNVEGLDLPYMIGCTLGDPDKELNDGDCVDGYVATSLRDFNIKVFIYK